MTWEVRESLTDDPPNFDFGTELTISSTRRWLTEGSQISDWVEVQWIDSSLGGRKRIGAPGCENFSNLDVVLELIHFHFAMYFSVSDSKLPRKSFVILSSMLLKTFVPSLTLVFNEDDSSFAIHSIASCKDCVFRWKVSSSDSFPLSAWVKKSVFHQRHPKKKMSPQWVLSVSVPRFCDVSSQ